MAIELVSNNAKTTLAQSLSATGSTSTTLAVVSGTGTLFPQPGTTNFPAGASTFFRLSLTDAATQTKREIVYVTARTGDSMTVVRGQDGTAAQDWSVGDICGVFVVAGTQQNVMQMEQAQAGYINYAVAAGTPNAIAVAFNPALLENMTAGVVANVLISSNNTGPVTLNVDGLGAFPVVNNRGVALVANELMAAVCYEFRFTGKQFVVDTTAPNLLLQDASNFANNIAVTTGIGLTQIGKGFTLYITVANTNTGAVTMTVDGIPGLGVRSREGAVFQSNVLKSGSTYRFIYNGTVFISDAQNQTDARVGEVRMWAGDSSQVAAQWGFGWHLADGTNGTIDLTNKFILGAGKTVTQGATGGSHTTTLSVANIPAHNHAVIDNGHTHTVNDRGHGHNTNAAGTGMSLRDPGHAHGVADPGHAHTINRGGWAQSGQDNGGSGSASAPNQYGTFSGSMSGVTASGTGIGIYASATGMSLADPGHAHSVQTATTGVQVVTGTTGVTTDNTGSGTAVTTTPPYYALCFVQFTNA
ncbi:hypothetical protein [Paraburkholderia tropica]|uniref:hypothetical protein n=1 Tax=Paraburkholderia tropica TaxID=92647 RepID=UPI002AAFAEB0|nr:hypothetical protein [Paraburkholderia tropica]